MSTVNDLLQLLKAQDEFNFGLHTLIESNTLYQRLLSVWSNVRRMLTADQHPTEPVPNGLTPEYHLRWLWARIEPDPALLWLRAAGLPHAEHTLRAVSVLQENAAVFPDGTMSKWVTIWLQKRAGVKVSTVVSDDMDSD